MTNWLARATAPDYKAEKWLEQLAPPELLAELMQWYQDDYEELCTLNDESLQFLIDDYLKNTEHYQEKMKCIA